MDNPGLRPCAPSRPAGRGVSSRAPAVYLLRREKPAKPMALISQPDRPVMRDNHGKKSAPPRRAGRRLGVRSAGRTLSLGVTLSIGITLETSLLPSIGWTGLLEARVASRGSCRGSIQREKSASCWR